jgi:MraZ protein
VSIPAEYRSLLVGERGTFFINRGVEKCIVAYPEQKWDRSVAESGIATFDDANTRWFKRLFFFNAREITCDQQGRILVPQDLMDYAGVKKEVLIIGMSDYVEIWDVQVWEGSSKEPAAEFPSKMEEMSRAEAARKRSGQTTGGT